MIMETPKSSITITRTRKVKDKTGKESNETLQVKQYYPDKTEDGVRIIKEWDEYFQDLSKNEIIVNRQNEPSGFVDEYYRENS